MADLKISQLPSATTPVAGTEVLPIVQSSTTRKVSIANLTAGRAIAAASVAVGGATIGTDAVAVTGSVSVTATSAKLLIGYADTSYNYYDADNHIFRTSGAAPVFSVDGNGNAAVGTTPVAGQRLTVYAAGGAGITVTNSTNKGRIYSYLNDLYIDAGFGGTAGSVYFRRSSSTLNSLQIDPNGNVLIYNTGGAPATPTGGGYLYVSAGALYYKGSSGTVTPLAVA